MRNQPHGACATPLPSYSWGYERGNLMIQSVLPFGVMLWVFVATSCMSLLPSIAPINSARVAQVERVTQTLNFDKLEDKEIVEILKWTMGYSSALQLAQALLPTNPKTEPEACA